MPSSTPASATKSTTRIPLIVGIIIAVVAAIYMIPNVSLHGVIESGGTLKIRDYTGSAQADSVILVITLYKDPVASQPSFEDRQRVRVSDGVYTVRFADWEWPYWQITNILRSNGGTLAADSCAQRHPPKPGENPWHCVVSGFPSKREKISSAINLSVTLECLPWGK